MQIIHSEREYTGKASVLALGTFDGVHIGHAALIRRAHDIAADMGADCVVCTFDRHPLAVLHPERMNVYNKNTGRLIKFAYAAERKK